MILGGTLGELLVPLLCAMYFWWKRETSANAFCGFWFFNNFLYIGAYIADARTSAFPLVDAKESDWTILFMQWGILGSEQQIGHTMRVLRWLGMVAAASWLASRVWRSPEPKL